MSCGLRDSCRWSGRRIVALAAIAAAPAHGPLEALPLRFRDARGHRVLRRGRWFRHRRRAEAGGAFCSYVRGLFVLLVFVMFYLFLMFL